MTEVILKGPDDTNAVLQISREHPNLNFKTVQGSGVSGTAATRVPILVIWRELRWK
jgi:hypothetical protein